MNQDDAKNHWEAIYTQKSPLEVSWFQEQPTTSLQIIRDISEADKSIIDVGGGASLLVDYLLKAGYSDLSVLDISHHALEYAKRRLDEQANKVHWIEANITQFNTSRYYNIWHDRAVFHFLTTQESRTLYIQSLMKSTESGSYVIIATFAKDGPTKCSGLDVIQYDTQTIQKEFGIDFLLLNTISEIHHTPTGKDQHFLYFVFQRK